MEKIAAFAYLRVSGKGQVKGDGFPRQRKAITTYATANGYSIAKVYEEKGISGTVENMDRPAWAEMITRILSNGVKTILVENLGRLTRDAMLQEFVIRDLKRQGIELVSVSEPDLCSDDPSRKMLRGIMGNVYEYEKNTLVLKLRVARDRKSAGRGERIEGRKPFGTRPDEQKVLARMRALASDGLDHNRIADRLNAEHKPTRTGKPWSGVVVKRIIERNPIDGVEVDVVKALQGLGSSRKDAEAAVARVRRDGDSFDALFRRASATR